jgi:multiple sugar transport system substrate-binding protein
MNKCIIAAWLVVLMAAGLLVVGCGPTPAGPEEGVLRVWTTWAGDASQIQALFDRYTHSGGTPVKVSNGLNLAEILSALNSPTPPDVVILSTNEPVRLYHERGLIEPLNGWIASASIDLSDIYPAALAQCEMGHGARACLPWGGDVYALYWNKALFKAAGLDAERPPQTMEELRAYAEALTVRDEDGELVQLGFVPDLSRSHADLYAHMLGSSWLNVEGTALAANSQAMVDALEWQASFYDTVGAEEVTAFVRSFDHYANSHHPVFAGARLDCQQCHRQTPVSATKLPDRGFYEGCVAMIVGGAWQVGPNSISRAAPQLEYGVAPFPAPVDHTEHAGSTVVQGPVALVPAAAVDKSAAAELLAWMMRPEVLAEEALVSSALPTSRSAAQDPRFAQIRHIGVLIELMADAESAYNVSTSISQELNEALRQVEEEALHNGGDPVRLLDELQAEFAPRLKEALAHFDDP